MIEPASIYREGSLLPDVSQIAPPAMGQSPSALAGISSGRDYTSAIAAAIQPRVQRPTQQMSVDNFDLPPQPPKMTPGERLRMERRVVAAQVRSSLVPDVQMPVDVPTPIDSQGAEALPGNEPSLFPGQETNNILLPIAPPEESVIKDIPPAAQNFFPSGLTPY